MSQPPPPYQPGPYPGAPYPGGYAPPPSNDGAKVALIVVGAVLAALLLFCGGVFAVIFYIVNSVEDAIGEYDGDRRGGPDNPITVTEGEAFTIDGLDYADGWRIDTGVGRYGEDAIVGLEVVNDRDDRDSKAVSIDFTFLDGTTEVGEISCYSDGSIAYERSATVPCSAYGSLPTSWESIEVSASY